LQRLKQAMQFSGNNKFNAEGKVLKDKPVTEIDVVVVDPEGKNLILGECKYWQNPVGLNVLFDLEKKAEQVPWEKKNRTVWYVLFSPAGFTDDLKSLAADREDLLLIEE